MEVESVVKKMASELVSDWRTSLDFVYCGAACFPQIPRVQDVLYALRLSEDDFEGYMELAANWPGYVSAVHKVAAIVGWRLVICSCGTFPGEWDMERSRGVDPECLRPYDYVGNRGARLDLDRARRLIAAVIVELTPVYGRGSAAYREAVELLSDVS